MMFEFGSLAFRPRDECNTVLALVVGMGLPWAGALAQTINSVYLGRRECELMKKVATLKSSTRQKLEVEQNGKEGKEKCAVRIKMRV